MAETILSAIDSASNFLWTYIIIALLVGCAIYFTIKLRFVQFRMFGEMWRTLFDSGKSHKREEDTHKPISSFRAFVISLSSRVGTGNLAGVASAIFVGGPGAVFWMWIMALLGSATAFVESTLAQLYKLRGEKSYIGGPAYYMWKGLNKRWFGVLFAVLITLTFGMANQVVQSNTICDAMNDTFGLSKTTVGIIMTAITLFIIFGGIHRISKFSAIVVPFMAIGYILLSLYVVISNISVLPGIFGLIIDNAFGLNQAVGGMVGAAVLQGVKRGLFSNEAGEGSAPNAAATADVSHPIKQGLVQALGVFTDTLIICTCTALIILVSGKYTDGADGIVLTAQALESEIGQVGRYFVTFAILFFAYSSIIGNYYYGETNVHFINQKKSWLFGYRIICAVTVMCGALVSLQTAWCLVDIVMGLMTICNLVAIALLSNRVVKLLKNYEQQKREKKDPTFQKSMLPEYESEIPCWE